MNSGENCVFLREDSRGRKCRSCEYEDDWLVMSVLVTNMEETRTQVIQDYVREIGHATKDLADWVIGLGSSFASDRKLNVYRKSKKKTFSVSVRLITLPSVSKQLLVTWQKKTVEVPIIERLQRHFKVECKI